MLQLQTENGLEQRCYPCWCLLYMMVSIQNDALSWDTLERGCPVFLTNPVFFFYELKQFPVGKELSEARCNTYVDTVHESSSEIP